MAKWLAALIIFFPLSIHKMDFRGSFFRGLTIQLKRTSPAYAALEDDTHSYAPRVEHANFQEIVKVEAKKIRIAVPLASAPAQRLALRTLVIKQSFKTREPLQANSDLRVQS